jgi:hypothetical protein
MDNTTNEFNEDSQNLENVVDDVTTENNVDMSDDEVSDDIDERDAKIEELEAKNKKLFARLKKTPEKKEEKAETETTGDDTVTLDMLLKSTGKTDNEIADARMIAGFQNIKLMDAFNTAEFKSLETARAEKTRVQSAQLGTSRGKKAFKRPSLHDEGLSSADHREL